MEFDVSEICKNVGGKAAFEKTVFGKNSQRLRSELFIE